MKYIGSAPVRQPVPELTEPELPVPPAPGANPQADGNSLIYLRILWEKRRLLLRALLFGLLAGALLALAIPASFESITRLMPPDNQSSSGLAMLAALTAKSGGGVGAVAGDLLGIKSSGALFVGVLRSRTVEDRLVDSFQLRKVYSVRLEGDARNKLSDNTSVTEDRKSGIITISVTDRDPKRAAAIAQAYVDELNLLVAQLSTSSARRERVFLEERLRAVKKDLDDASREFSQFSSKNSTLDIKEQARAMVQGAATLEGELIAAESELKGLEQIYTDNNVRVRSVKARIEELRRQLDKFSGKATAGADQSVDSPDSSYPSIRKLPLLGVTYADLYRRVQIQEAVFGALTQQYELAKVQEAKETPSVRVLDPANVPEKKSFPPRTLITIFGGVLVFGFAVGVILLRFRWDKVDSNDPNKVLTQEIIETVNAYMPWAEPNGSRMQAATHKVWVRLVQRGTIKKGSVSR